MYTRKISKCTRFRNLHLRVDGERALIPVISFSNFLLTLRVDGDRALEIVSFFKFSSLVLLIRVMTSRNFRVRSVA